MDDYKRDGGASLVTTRDGEDSQESRIVAVMLMLGTLILSNAYHYCM